MKKTSHYTSPKFLVLYLLAIVLIYEFAVTALVQRGYEYKIQRTFTKQTATLTPLVNNLVGQSPKEAVSQCSEDSHTYFTSNVICTSSYTYNWQSNNDASSQKVNDAANALDKALAQNGWTPDRPQDKTTTIHDLMSINVSDLEPSTTGDSVSFHKNIGSTSCNLNVAVSFNQSSQSATAINVNAFGCQQTMTYPKLHLRVTPPLGA